MPLKLVTTQKYESLAWETVMAPAAMAMTTSALATGVSKPSADIIGKTMADVVVSATVEEPCAVFRTAETRKGEDQSDDRQLCSVALDEGDEVGGGDDAPQYTAGLSHR